MIYSRWFKGNKSFLNNRKTKYTLFHEKSSKDDLHLRLLALNISDKKIKGKIKRLGVMLHENKSLEKLIRIIETKLVKKLDY